MLHSLLATQRRPLAVHLLASAEVGEESVGHLTRMIAEHGGTLTVHRLEDELPEASSWTQLLPPELGRMLSVDNDVLVGGPLDSKATHLSGAAGLNPWHPQADPDTRERYWAHREQTPWRAENALTHPMHEFFDGLRITRRERYASTSASARRHRRRRAIITIVHNEPIFLPLWLRYYSRFYAPEDIYVLDHGTDDGSTSAGGFTRIPVSHQGYDAEWVRDVIAAQQEELLGRYDSVLVADCDEIVAPDPAFGTLGDYLERFDEEYVNCLGYEIIHLPDEPAFDPGRAVLEQRGYWFANDGYDKPALASTSIERVPGLHARADRKMNLDPDLRLIHLHRLDYAACFARHRGRVGDRSDRDVEAGHGGHLLADDEQEFSRWFYEQTAFDEYGIHLEIEPIPRRWRSLV